MTVSELIAELGQLDQSAVVCARFDASDPFEVDNRARVIGGLNWSLAASFDSLTDAGIFGLEEVTDEHDADTHFRVVLIG